MAKSKKKKVNKKKQGPPKPKSNTIKFTQKDRDGSVIVFASLCSPNLGQSLQDPDAVLYMGDTPKKATPLIRMEDNAMNVVHKNGYNAELHMRVLKDFKEKTLLPMHTALYDALSRFMNDIPEFSKALNIYDPNPDVPENFSMDTLDFREHTRESYTTGIDLVQQMNDLLNAPDFKYDPSWTWSTNEYFRVQLTDYLYYNCHRLLYDDEQHGARYLIVEYRKLTSACGEELEIPTMCICFQVSVLNVDTDQVKYIYEPGTEPIEGITDNWDFEGYAQERTTGSAIISGYQDIYGPKFKAVRANILGVADLVNAMSHIKNDQRHYIDNRKMPDRLINIIGDILDYDICGGLTPQTPGFTQKQEFLRRYHMLAAASTVTAALMIVNKRLKDKKLSKPVHTADPIPVKTTQEAEIILENKPERKTRILGNNIKITSDKRPDTPTMEKIIKYHIPEWGRKEHLRRLKSGKIVRVKAATCKRKCVDMHGAKSNLPVQGVDYKVKPNNSKI